MALLVASTACQANTAAPTLIRLDPSELPVTELPRVAALYGKNLQADANLSLDDRGAAEVSTLQVAFGGVAAPWVSYRSADELAVTVPPELTPGNYDVLVQLGPHRLTLPSGLRIVGDGSTNVWAVSTSSAELATSAAPSDSTSLAASEPTEATSNQPTSASGMSDSTSSADASTSETLRCAAGDFGPLEVVALQGYLGTLPWSPTLTDDALTMYFTDVTSGTEQLWKATRTDRNAVFVATVAESLFATGGTGTPYVTPNGLSLYFYSTQVTGFGGGDLYVAKRLSPNADFGYPTALTELGSTALDYLPWVSPDELSIAFVSTRSGSPAYYVASRTTTNQVFSAPTLLASLTQAGNNGRLFISKDGLRAYFTSTNRPGGLGADDVWYADRTTKDGDFGDITNLTTLNSAGSEMEVTLSQDEEELFLLRSDATTRQLYRAVANCP